ncbi:MAG: S8 family serine peptidase [Chitinophagaceae bacterium]|nr:S8 family serine peptidase [Chitinophagaceae bacterium]
MKKKILLLFTIIGLCNVSQAQFTRYQVKLKNKGGTSHTIANPSTYLSQRAIDRRTKYGIAIDSTDLPVSPSYITQIANTPNVTILNISKWQNAISIQVSNQSAITTINAFPFVESVTGIAARAGENGRTELRNKFQEEEIVTPIDFSQRTEQVTADYFNYGTNSFNEIHLHNGEFLHNIGLRGQGMQIGMLDNGYNNYTILNAFDSVRLQNQILGTWDFVNRESNVTNDGSHGMNCFSTIAANIPGQFIGKAPKASFWLYKTEDDNGEYPIEEFNWVCGVERADSSGADIISSSVGYFDFDNASFNYTYANMNGNTTIAAKGADMAAKKGLLVFNSIGNEGNSAWKFLITPSDADSVVAVGAVSASGVIGSFSSYGPSSDGQIKPDMASVGVSAMIQTSSNTIGFSNGTSFACPNMAGLGTCLWQGFPEFNNMRIIRELQKASSKFSTPDDRVGYGIPNMKLAFSNLLIDYATSSSTVTNCNVTISWISKDVAAMQYEIERKGPVETVYTKIGLVSPQAGTILTNRSYQFINNVTGLATGNYSYRIRQIIDTAAASFTAVYIDTTNINSTTNCVIVIPPEPFKELITVQPNPVSNKNLTIIVETPYAINNMPINIYDSKGSLVLQLKDSKAVGKKTIEIPMGKFAPGIYYIKFYNENVVLGTVEAFIL